MVVLVEGLAVTLPYEWVLTRLIPIFLLLGGGFLWHHQEVKKAEQAVHGHYAQVLADTHGKTAEAAAQFRAAETAWQTAIDKESKDGQDRIDTARRDAATAGAERGRLLADVARYRAAARAASYPGTASAGPPAGDALDLFANLFSRADARAGELAEFADAAHAAGLTCERSYDALTKPSQPDAGATGKSQ